MWSGVVITSGIVMPNTTSFVIKRHANDKAATR